jgi:uncharacterized protein (TIGR03545 family)
MSRWLRREFTLPRVLMCLVAALAAQYALGLAVRTMTMRWASQLLAARVNVANARVSLSDGHVLLGRMNVAEPRESGGTWFTAEGCELEVATAPLLAKQVIVSKARLRGIRLGEPVLEQSAERGTIPGRMVPAPFCSEDIAKGDSPRRADRWFDDHAVEAAEDRLSKIDDRFSEKLVERLESVRLTTELCSSWPTKLAALNARAAELERIANELEQAVTEASENPLRKSALDDGATGKVGELQKSFACLSDDLQQLPERLEEQRRLIIAARREDEELVRGKMHVEAIDGKLLNAYLLRRQASRQLDGLAACLHWLRQIGSESPPQPATNRGEDVLFAGMRRTPNFLIRSLELQGEIGTLGRPVEFRGLVSNVTTAPSLHTEPIQVRISGKEPGAFAMRATIDRTCGRSIDELFINHGEFSMCERSLGQAEQLQLKLTPSAGSLSVHVRVDGNKLAGEIQLVQKQLGITPTFACEGSEMPIAQALERSLAQFNSMTTRVSLGGTIDQPKCTLWSNLGPAVAEALQHGLQNHADMRAQVVLDNAKRHVDEQLAELERQMAEHQEKFAGEVADLPQRIDALARSQTRGERISVEQAGRRLPATSILR